VATQAANLLLLLLFAQARLSLYLLDAALQQPLLLLLLLLQLLPLPQLLLQLPQTPHL
jgi:hypothetical protein